MNTGLDQDRIVVDIFLKYSKISHITHHSDSIYLVREDKKFGHFCTKRQKLVVPVWVQRH